MSYEHQIVIGREQADGSWRITAVDWPLSVRLARAAAAYRMPVIIDPNTAFKININGV